MTIASQGRYLNIVLLVALAFMTASNILAYQQMQKAIDSYERVTHTYDVLVASDNLQLRLNEADFQINQAYLTHRPLTSQASSTLLSQINKNIFLLSELTKDNPIQRQNLANLEAAIKERVIFQRENLSQNREQTNKKQLELRQSISLDFGQSRRLCKLI
ncbi:MAG: CHASE3 domain-containing protein [Gammaproteobacteria bacterium]